MRAIGTYIQYLKGECEVVEIVGYEIRKDATYLIVKGFVFDNKVNILGEGKTFILVD